MKGLHFPFRFVPTPGSFLSPGSRIRFQATLYLCLATVAGIWPAFLVRVLFDRVVPERDSRFILPVISVALCMECFSLLLRSRSEQLLLESTARIRGANRRSTAETFCRLTPERLRSTTTGGLLRHFEDAAELGGVEALFVRMILGPAISLVLLVPVMIAFSPLLSGIRFLPVIPAVVLGNRMLRSELEHEREYRESSRSTSCRILDGYEGFSDIWMTGRRGAFLARLRGDLNRLGLIERQRDFHRKRRDLLAGALTRAGGVIGPGAAVWLIVDGQLSFGTFIAFSILAARSMASVADLLGGIRGICRMGNCRNRREQFGASGSPRFFHSLPTDSASDCGLRVDNLVFRYSPGDSPSRSVEPILAGASFNIEPGEWVSLKGANGSGKSTLMSVLMGTLVPDSGVVRWGSADLPGLTPEGRTRYIGGIPQFPCFFDASLRDNLALFAPSAADSKLTELLHLVGLGGLLRRVGGLDGTVPGQGKGLSGGEKRRMAAVRLLLNPPPMVILDEPFASLSPAAATDLASCFKRNLKDCSLLVVDHRERPFLGVDRSLSISGGLVT